MCSEINVFCLKGHYMYIPNTCLAKHGLTYRYIHVQVICISKFNSGEQYVPGQ